MEVSVIMYVAKLAEYTKTTLAKYTETVNCHECVLAKFCDEHWSQCPTCWDKIQED